MKTKYTLCSFGLTSCLALAIDLNENGINDLYEAQFPEISGTSPTSDLDGDGFSNLEEAAALTNPTDPQDHFACISPQEDTSSYTISWPSKNGLSYQLQHSVDLNVWTAIASAVNGNGGMVSSRVAKSSLPTSDRNFFRVIVAAEIDADADGVSDWVEELLGFDPANSASVRSATNGGDLQQITNLLTGANPQGGLVGTTSAGVPSEEHASRFLTQTTFGPRIDDITALRALGSNAYEKWIDSQITLSPSYTYPYILHTYNTNQTDRARVNAGQISPDQLPYLFVNQDRLDPLNLYTPWMRNAMNAKDQLRQRVAWALSQILVVSRNESNLTNSPSGLSHYYDQLIQHSFGSYADLLKATAKHPVMGLYLSHIFSQRADPVSGRAPDENFAREIMQLFSIGLFDLHADGSQILDENGLPQESYNNEDVQALARIFTGMKIGGQPFGIVDPNGTTDLTKAMDWDTDKKDFEPKTFLQVRGLEISENSAHYVLTWPAQHDLFYAPQYLDENNIWIGIEPVRAQGDGLMSQEILKSLIGANKTLNQFRVKHHSPGVPQEAPPFSLSQNTSHYLLSLELEANRRYEISFQRDGSTYQPTALIPSGNFTGRFLYPVSIASVGGNGLTAQNFRITSTRELSQQDAQEELDLLIRILTTHPNTAPFISKHLIKHLVTSNPSPAYVSRVSSIFKNDGSGASGNLAATVKAVLLDPEARGSRFLTDPTWGKLKEPMLRLTNFARAFDAGRDDNYDSDPVNQADHFTQFQWWSNIPDVDFLQTPFSAPSVFNFYEPDYSHPGILSDSSLESPEFQILNAGTVIRIPNRFLFHLTTMYHDQSTLNTPDFRNDFARDEITFSPSLPSTFTENDTQYSLTWNFTGGIVNTLHYKSPNSSTFDRQLRVLRPNSEPFTFPFSKGLSGDDRTASDFKIIVSSGFQSEDYLDRLNLILANGMMKNQDRFILKNTIARDPDSRIQDSSYLGIIAPASAIQK